MKLFRHFHLLSLFLTSTFSNAAQNNFPDLVAVKDGSPAQMFEVGIKELGGMSRFIKKGQTVLVKPNIGWDKTPSEGANTHPDLVGKIVKMAYEAGASKVFVFDHTCNEEKACYRNSGIEKAVKENGGIMRTGDDKKNYRDVKIPGAKILKEAKVHELYLDSNVIINVPILKHHISTKMSAALKNLMGVVWDRQFWHREGLHECIADFALLKKVDLTVVDAYTMMIRNGPQGISTKDLKTKKMQILSTDMVLADTAALKILEASFESAPYLKLAEAFGYGTTAIDKKNVKKISVKN